MTMLPEAIRNSRNESALYRLPDGSTLLVKRVVGRPEPYQQEEYAVSIQRGDGDPQELFATDDLAEAIGRLRDLRLPGLESAGAGWQPADTDVEHWTPASDKA